MGSEMCIRDRAYGDHSSIRAHTTESPEKIVSDVVLERALVFDVSFLHEISGLRVSPLGVVEEPKFEISVTSRFQRRNGLRYHGGRA